MFTAKDARDFIPIARKERKDAQIKDITDFLESEKFKERVQSAIRLKRSEALISIPTGLEREFVIEELTKNGYYVNSSFNYNDRELSITWNEPSNSYFDR